MRCAFFFYNAARSWHISRKNGERRCQFVTFSLAMFVRMIFCYSENDLEKVFNKLRKGF